MLHAPTGIFFRIARVFVRAAARVFLRDNPTSNSHSRRPVGSSRPTLRENRTRARPRALANDAMQSMADGVLLIGAFAIAAVAEAAPPRPHVAEGERVDKARGSPAEVWSSELLARRGACDHEELERRTQRRAKVSRRRRRELPSKNPTELSTGRTRCRAPRPPRTAPSPAGSETRECEERADAKKSPVQVPRTRECENIAVFFVTAANTYS